MDINEVRKIKSIESTRMMHELPDYKYPDLNKNKSSNKKDTFRPLLKEECEKIGINLEEVEKQNALSKQRTRIDSK